MKKQKKTNKTEKKDLLLFLGSSELPKKNYRAYTWYVYAIAFVSIASIAVFIFPREQIIIIFLFKLACFNLLCVLIILWLNMGPR